MDGELAMNEIQKQLIRASEDAHYEGLRHKGLSGTVCEDLLIVELRKSVPSLNFDRGMVKFAAREAKGSALIDSMSSQMDVIAYEGQPIYRTLSQSIVHISQVKGVIEIKKWTQPKMMRESVKEKIARIRKQLKQESRREIAVFFVTFRYHDRGKFENWKAASANFSTPWSYCFSGNHSRKNGSNLYPWEEAWWNEFGEYPYQGQSRQSVADISSL